MQTAWKPKDTFRYVYFFVSFVELFNEVIIKNPSLYFFKLLIVPALAIYYYLCSSKQNWIYYLVLLTSFLLNFIFFIPKLANLQVAQTLSSINHCLMLAVISKKLLKTNFWSLLIAIIPFVTVFAYLYVLVINSGFLNPVPSAINIIVLSIIGGVALSNYMFRETKINTLLLISSLLFTSQIFIYALQKYYSQDAALQPITVIIFIASHYVFNMFVLEREKI